MLRRRSGHPLDTGGDVSGGQPQPERLPLLKMTHYCIRSREYISARRKIVAPPMQAESAEA
ncbi:hypothetical protein [Shewanella sp. NIFS-20-20]|uniref:hypothetical protein n=1 Tax=Shewanella sp. NIFS-20-20 TaxID=2853806 RepID=UPI001C48B234|nr:hypothetical protein [Shewanella sp. NIFS-20-20]MBV7316678.1 hypothetical protein [Shewanella sp. NIFS-20-20]